MLAALNAYIVSNELPYARAVVQILRHNSDRSGHKNRKHRIAKHGYWPSKHAQENARNTPHVWVLARHIHVPYVGVHGLRVECLLIGLVSIRSADASSNDRNTHRWRLIWVSHLLKKCVRCDKDALESNGSVWTKERFIVISR